MLTVVIALGVVSLNLLANAAILWICARLVRAGSPGFRRSLVCVSLLFVLGFFPFLALVAIPVQDGATQLLILAVALVIWLLLVLTTTTIVLRITFARSLLLAIPFLGLSIAAGIGLAHVVKATTIEAFVMPTNSMAPTLIG